MSTIVYREGMMAADTRAYTGGRGVIGCKTKVQVMPSGELLGVSTTIPGGGERVTDWYLAGRPADFELPENFTLLAVKPDGTAMYAKDTRFVSGPIEAPFFAIGSGEDYALGALEAGKSAIEALKIAVKLDVWSDYPLRWVNHSGIKGEVA